VCLGRLGGKSLKNKKERLNMKKSIIAATLALMAGFGSMDAQAAEADSKGSIGVGSYAIGVTMAGRSFTFAGTALTGSYNINDKVSVAGHVYSVTNTDAAANEDIGGYDVFLRSGKNGKGFSYYLGVGLFSETLSTVGFASTDASGMALGYGIGYNWDNVALMLEGNARTTGDYSDAANGASVSEVASSLNVSYRF